MFNETFSNVKDELNTLLSLFIRRNVLVKKDCGIIRNTRFRRVHDELTLQKINDGNLKTPTPEEGKLRDGNANTELFSVLRFILWEVIREKGVFWAENNRT